MTRRMMMIAAVMFVLGAPTMAVIHSNLVQAQTTQLIDGQITKVDAAEGKLTIKHGPIKKFDMDGMTMVFRAQDPAMLKSVKIGDKVKFDVEKVKGQFTVTKIEKVR
ncbi:copper-binding protein [Pseudorhodoplanes sp.]|uniref:copper-binding protein n=1 Tax=Pseudorhodoplanes sp. TaxID=1934341 RepID=UPI00391CD0DB